MLNMLQQESVPAAQDAEPAPLMNGHADRDSEHCNGVDLAEGPHPNHSADEDPADGAPEYLQVSSFRDVISWCIGMHVPLCMSRCDAALWC